MKYRLIAYILFACALQVQAQTAQELAQRIDVDRRISAGGLQLFPSLDNPNEYYYMPDKVQIGRTPQGLPQFSFLRFFKPAKTGNTGITTVQKNMGGIIHALVELQVTDAQKQKANAELQALKPGSKITGALMYDKCYFTLITSLATKDFEKIKDDTGENTPSMKLDTALTRAIAGYGSGPVLEGEKAAISIRLTALGAQIFWHSLQMATPDISFQFEVEFSGYRRPIAAKIEANFDRIYDSKFYQTALNASFPIGNIVATADVDVSKMMDSLFTENIIKITMSGDATADKVIDDVKGEFISMMFDKATDSKGAPTFNAMGIGELEKGAEKKTEKTESSESSPKKTPTIKLSTTYRQKKVRRKGIYVMELNRYTAKKINSTFTENIGNFSRYKNDPRIFKEVNLDEIFGKQREISSLIDGFNSTDFGSIFNSVNVRLTKTHERGAASTDEFLVTKNNLQDAALNGKLMYAWKDDTDAARFDQYKYESIWSYVGVGEVRVPMQESNANSITVTPPYVPLKPRFVITPAPNLVFAIIKVHYKVGEKELMKQILYKPTETTALETSILVAAGAEQTFRYEVVWKFPNNVTKNTPLTSTNEQYILLTVPE
jgi:hypothetical protein